MNFPFYRFYCYEADQISSCSRSTVFGTGELHRCGDAELPGKWTTFGKGEERGRFAGASSSVIQAVSPLIPPVEYHLVPI